MLYPSSAHSLSFNLPMSDNALKSNSRRFIAHLSRFYQFPMGMVRLWVKNDCGSIYWLEGVLTKIQGDSDKKFGKI
jgi:hypothetical protein